MDKTALHALRRNSKYYLRLFDVLYELCPSSLSIVLSLSRRIDVSWDVFDYPNEDLDKYCPSIDITNPDKMGLPY